MFKRTVELSQEQFEAMVDILDENIEEFQVIEDCKVLCMHNNSLSQTNIANYDTNDGILYY